MQDWTLTDENAKVNIAGLDVLGRSCITLVCCMRKALIVVNRVITVKLLYALLLRC